MAFIFTKSTKKVFRLGFNFFFKKKKEEEIIRYSKFSFNFKKNTHFPFENSKLFETKFLFTYFPGSRDIFWFRFDLRIKDNSCLETALTYSPPPILVFCPDVDAIAQFGKKRKKFFIESLNDVKEQFRSKNIFFLSFNESPEKVLPWLITKFNSKSIFYSINPFSEKKMQSGKFLIGEFKKAGATPRIFVGNLTIYPQNCFFEKKKSLYSFSEFLKYFKTERRCNDFPISPEIQNYPTLLKYKEKNFSDDENFFVGGETCILSNLKKIHKSQILDKNFEKKNLLKTIKPWIDFGCITPKTLLSFLGQIDLIGAGILIFNFFLSDFEFLKRLILQKKIFTGI